MKILVTLPVEERHKQLLERVGNGADFIYVQKENVTEEIVQSAEIIIGKAPVAMLGGSKLLKWIQLPTAGTDGYCAEGALPEGTLLTNASGAYGFAISEHMIAMLFMLRKKLHLYYSNQLNGKWSDEGQVTAISGSTVLILGMGDIGSEFAQRMKALGCYIIGIKRRVSEKPDYVDELLLTDQLDDAIIRADVIAVTLPGTSDTKGMINNRRIQLMKQNAIVMNVGRGPCIDTDALYDALIHHQIGGAALDVTDPEPLLPDHPLWSAPNTIITPHVSGGYSLPETFERIVGICARNIENYINGRDLENIVDFRTGYRI